MFGTEPEDQFEPVSQPLEFAPPFWFPFQDTCPNKPEQVKARARKAAMSGFDFMRGHGQLFIGVFSTLVNKIFLI